MYHIGDDYLKAFENHFNSDETKALFEKARMLKSTERDKFIKKQKNHKRRVWFSIIAVFVVIIYFGRDILPDLFAQLLPNLMEQGWGLVAIAASGIILLAIIRALRRSKAEQYTAVDKNYFKSEYVSFYSNHILPWLVKPLDVSDLKLVISAGNSGRRRRNRNTSSTLKSVSYKVNNTKILADRDFINTETSTAIRGPIWRTQLNIANPLPYDVRIINNEGTKRTSLATVKLFGNDAHKFEFNTIEMSKMFDCYISIGKGRKTDNPIDQMFESGGILNLAAGAFAQKAYKTMTDNDISLEELPEGVGPMIKSFAESSVNNSREANRQKMEDNHLDIHRLISPMVEEVLLFIRHKYGPYNLVIGKGMRIDIAREPSITSRFNDRQEGLILDLFTPSLIDDSDISYERMLAIYEVFLLGHLLDKHFNTKE